MSNVAQKTEKLPIIVLLTGALRCPLTQPKNNYVQHQLPNIWTFEVQKGGRLGILGFNVSTRTVSES